jgi:hypothetical protein
LERLEKNITPVLDSENRSERRSSALSLSLTNPNELIEGISGTVVDMFGNLIDINRNILDVPEGNSHVDLLQDTFEQVRHTMAYHMEINTRKGWRFDDSPNVELYTDPLQTIWSSVNNARDRSRWFIDVDKEGLTKINIPATSETGSVPLITRYETSSVLKVDSNGSLEDSTNTRTIEDTKKVFRNEGNRDIFVEQVGPGGIDIVGNSLENRLSGYDSSWVENDSGEDVTSVKMGSIIQAGTAFHNITKTASTLLKKDINKDASDILENLSVTADLPAISTQVDPRLPINSSQPNAGGRSVHMNLDGSLEMSVGANTVDRASLTLDTAGALIARLGRDRSGRSAIVQTDGSIAVEVGGFDFVGESFNDQVDTRFVGRNQTRENILTLDSNQFRAGKVVIRVRRANESEDGPDTDDNLVIIDSTGVTVQSAGKFNLISKMDMTLQSDSRIILEAPKVQVYKDSPRFFSRTGKRIS